MRKTSAPNQTSQSHAAGPGRTHRSFEWPLLVYPVLFVATLAILYAVNRSIEKESPAPAKPPRAVSPDATAGTVPEGPAASGLSTAGRHAAGTSAGVQGVSRSGDGGVSQGRPSSVVGRMEHAVDLSRLTGADRSVALLRIAVDEKDHGRIKECLAQLVEMGDGAVAALSGLLGEEQGDTGLWAATALARIGTPAATGALLDQLAQVADGSYREELCQRASNIRNHDSWPLLLDTLLQSTDATVVRAAGASLGTMADAPVIDELIARYDAAATAADAERLAQVVRNIRSPRATESLLSLAGSPTIAPQDGLQEAAVAALAKVGDAQCVSHLLQRLEACPPGQDSQIFDTITRIDSPEAQASLLYAAAGNKEVSATHGQAAAIYALRNYPSEPTVALLERLVAQSQNETVLAAAARTLNDIRRLSPYAIAAKAEALQKSEQMLPLKPLEK